MGEWAKTKRRKKKGTQKTRSLAILTSLSGFDTHTAAVHKLETLFEISNPLALHL
jgi:hypothetical protein